MLWKMASRMLFDGCFQYFGSESKQIENDNLYSLLSLSLHTGFVIIHTSENTKTYNDCYPDKKWQSALT